MILFQTRKKINVICEIKKSVHQHEQLVYQTSHSEVQNTTTVEVDRNLCPVLVHTYTYGGICTGCFNSNRNNLVSGQK